MDTSVVPEDADPSTGPSKLPELAKELVDVGGFEGRAQLVDPDWAAAQGADCGETSNVLFAAPLVGQNMGLALRCPGCVLEIVWVKERGVQLEDLDA